MELWHVDEQLMIYYQRGEYDQAERFLLQQYAAAKQGGNRTAIRHILDGIANFYRLPYKRDLQQAERYYREMEATFPDRESDLRLAMFYFYSLQDFAKTVSKVHSMGSLGDQAKNDIQFYYSALGLKGQALLYLKRFHEAEDVLREIRKTIALSPNQIPYGDEFNFINEMVKRRLELGLCKELVSVIVTRVRDAEFESKFLSVLKGLESA